MFSESPIVVFLHASVGVSGVWSWLTSITASSFLPYLLGVGALAVLVAIRPFRARVWALALTGLSLIIGRGILASFIPLLWNRPRPFLSLGFQPTFLVNPTSAFPSGHVAFLVALAAAVFIVNRRAGWLLGAGALLVGVARVAAGVHWPTDVLGGVAVGILGAWVAWLLIKQYRPIAVSQAEVESAPGVLDVVVEKKF
ncbi:MAG: phosphatase PAP2 family protein [bacterium]|nr:phosphatase PAP2 family protein [bacterium]